MGAVAPTMDGGNFALADSGDRLLMFAPPSAEEGGPMARRKVMVNWFGEIGARFDGR